MWRGYLLVAVSGCGFTTGGPPREQIPDAGTTAIWMFDTAADFASAGHVATDMTIDARGSLTPNAYTYGGLVTHGVIGTRLWSAADTSWARTAGPQVSGVSLWCGEQLASTTKIEYLGIPSDSQAMSVWFEGEVLLRSESTERFQLTGNDIAFVDLALPGTTEFTRVVSAGSPAQAPVPVPVTGWYPIRIGFADGDRSRGFDFTHSDAGGDFVHWTRDRLRARTSELSGVMSTVFARQILGGGDVGQLPVPRVEPGDLMTQTMFNPLPVGAPSNDDWSAHFAGQIYIVQPGPYTLTITSDDGNRGRLADKTGSTSWGRNAGSGNAVTPIQATLPAGWNDVVVDYNQTFGGRKLAVALDGPDFHSAAVPRSQLRPVEPAADRLVYGADDAPHRIVDAGAAGTAMMTVVGYPGETVTGIDIAVQVNSPRWDQLRFDLERPGGAVVAFRDHVGLAGDGRQMVALSSTSMTSDPLAPLLNAPAVGDWRLRVTDTVAGNGDSMLELARITLHVSGGPERVARAATWVSPVLDATTRVFAIDNITWEDHPAAGATLQVRLRACTQPDCSDGMWSVPVSRSTGFLIGPGRYLQLRVDMTSDGVVEPELRSLTVTYRRDQG